MSSNHDVPSEHHHASCQRQGLAHGRTQYGLTVGEVGPAEHTGCSRATKTTQPGRQETAHTAQQPDTQYLKERSVATEFKEDKALRIPLPMQGTPVRSPVRELRSHKLRGR
ncbi:unnamed protein product [Rangifer tarandus platyrhynchus]|uniref:Uncharacterized protein n=1 Tax=Rangifer tarandus platyrhynchus TaxID=3082113 RepID=A0AC60A2C6_RANTA